MKEKTGRFLGVVMLLAGLSGCVAGEYTPYYDPSYSAAPYYGTTFVPAYAYGEIGVVGGGYYPYHRAQNIYSKYNTHYWQHQNTVQQRGAAPQQQRGNAPERGGNAEPHGGGGYEHH
jgi:hypothetical protein